MKKCEHIWIPIFADVPKHCMWCGIPKAPAVLPSNRPRLDLGRRVAGEPRSVMGARRVARKRGHR